MLYDKAPLFWDEQISGGGSSTHSTVESAVTMTVTTNGDGVYRRTRTYHNYQPGKSQLILLTGVFGIQTANVTKRVGAYDSNSGMFLQITGTATSFVIRKSGLAFETANKGSWNVDNLDGNGPSGKTLDLSKAQILFFDYEWLGVGRVRCGFVIDGLFCVCHEFLHANVITSTYMATPNLPLSYEINSAGGNGSLVQICGAVISEGGIENNGLIRARSGTPITDLDAGEITALLRIRLKSTHLSAAVLPTQASMLVATGSSARWMVLWNPTIAGTPAWTDIGNSAVQYANGANDQIVSDQNVILATGFFSLGQDSVFVDFESTLQLGSTISGTPDEIVLAAEAIGTNNETAYGALQWRELL